MEFASTLNMEKRLKEGLVTLKDLDGVNEVVKYVEEIRSRFTVTDYYNDIWPKYITVTHYHSDKEIDILEMIYHMAKREHDRMCDEYDDFQTRYLKALDEVIQMDGYKYKLEELMESNWCPFGSVDKESILKQWEENHRLGKDRPTAHKDPMFEDDTSSIRENFKVLTKKLFDDDNYIDKSEERRFTLARLMNASDQLMKQMRSNKINYPNESFNLRRVHSDEERQQLLCGKLTNDFGDSSSDSEDEMLQHQPSENRKRKLSL